MPFIDVIDPEDAEGKLAGFYDRVGAERGNDINDCEYCITHHTEALERYEDDQRLLERLAKDPKTAPLDPEDKALVTYAMKLTSRPGEVGEADVQALREAGFDDEDILAAGAVTSYFNFVNRLNLGLGAELEDETDREYAY